MIWSTPLPRLIEHARFIEDSGIVLKTGEQLNIPLVAAGLTLPDEPVRFYEVPLRAHKDLGKLVIPHIHLDDTGHLDTEAPAIYGVTALTNVINGQPYKSEVRTREIHVYTEDLAFRRGILTDYGRASAEAIGIRLVPEYALSDYALDRVAHLEALRNEVEASSLTMSTKSIRQIGAQLLRGIDVLSPYIS